jgi:hypothetical protein
MPINATQVTNELISYSVVTDKGSLVRLLERNGIQMPNNPSDKEVTLAVVMANSKSATFRKDLAKYLGSKLPKASEDFSQFVGNEQDFGFTGIDDFSFVGEEKFFNASSSLSSSNLLVGTKYATPTPAVSLPSATSGKKAFGDTKVGGVLTAIGSFLKDNVLTQENINAGIQIGLQSMANKSQAQQNNLQQQAVQLQQQQDIMKATLPASATKSNTMTYVWIGVAVVGVSLIGFLIYKNSKK